MISAIRLAARSSVGKAAAWVTRLRLFCGRQLPHWRFLASRSCVLLPLLLVVVIQNIMVSSLVAQDPKASPSTGSPRLVRQTGFTPLPRRGLVLADGAELYRVRYEYIPVLRMREAFGLGGMRRDLTEGLLVVVEAEGRGPNFCNPVIIVSGFSPGGTHHN